MDSNEELPRLPLKIGRVAAICRRLAFQLAWARKLAFIITMLSAGFLACFLWVNRTHALVVPQPVVTGMPGVAPISAVIPCNAEDFKYLPMILTSIANQTVMPHEVIMVVNIPKPAEHGSLLMDLQSPMYRMPSLAEETASVVLNGSQNETARLPGMIYRADPLRILPSGEYEAPKFDKPAEAVQYIVDVLPTVSESLRMIPDFKIFVRAGNHWAGDNRWWGANQTREGTEIVSFFDCDDYMHPQRFEIITRTFADHPELEALIHSYHLIKLTEWSKEILKFLGPVEYPPPEGTFQHSYKKLWDSLPVSMVQDNGTEPSQTREGYVWWYPKDMHLPGRNPGHNGWLTVRRDVLEEIPYPDIRRGQDSLYNWRLLQHRRFWNFINVRLGAYIRFK